MKKTDRISFGVVFTALAILVLAFFAPVKSYGSTLYTGNSASGPDTSLGSNSWVVVYDVSTENDVILEKLYYCDDANVTAVDKTYQPVRGGTVSYDLSSNTLTLTNAKVYQIFAKKMGDDFKIKLVGDNSAEVLLFRASTYTIDENNKISDYSFYGNSCTFIGDGTLTCGQIEMDAGFTESSIKLSPDLGDVTVNVVKRNTKVPLLVDYSGHNEPKNVFVADGIDTSDFTCTKTAWANGDQYFNYEATGSSYTLKPQRTSIEGASVSIPNQTYTGKALTPAPTVTLNGTTLVKDKDYQVTYANNTNAGTATVTITGINKYKGVKMAIFTITKKEESSTTKPAAPEPTFNKKGVIKSVKSNKKQQITIKWKKISGASGYELNHSKKKSFKKAGPNIINLSKKKKKDTIRNWPSGTWYLRLRPYKKVDGKKIYGKWSTVKKVKVK